MEIVFAYAVLIVASIMFFGILYGVFYKVTDKES